MKRILCLLLATSTLGGCVVLPSGPGYRDYGYGPPRVIVAPSWSGPYRGYGDGGWHREGGRYRGW